MKLKKCAQKISFILVMLMSSLTIFAVINFNIDVKAIETDNSEYNSIISWALSNDLPDGNYNVKVRGMTNGNEEEIVDYPVELINYYGDVIYTKEDADENGYIGLGDSTDEYKMLIVKFHGNLTIDEGVILTANTHTTTINDVDYELTYKKGMYIHVDGTLTNNGTISMSARGTYNQEGENVYLWKNLDGTYEYVPAIGAVGGTSVAATRDDTSTPGKKGEDGITVSSRSTAGGGSGGSRRAAGGSPKSGIGGVGTSYSGGSGGGGCAGRGTRISAFDGSSIGGSGGNGYTKTSNSTAYSAGGGAGNPGGIGNLRSVANTTYSGETGTGGLLIIYAKNILNNSNITSNGSQGGTTGSTIWPGGGSSGGGSINIFYSQNIENTGLYSADGGESVRYGGAGGTGTITTTKLLLSDDNHLSELTTSRGVLSPSFDSNIQEYNLTLDKYDVNFTLNGVLSDKYAAVSGFKTYSINPGEKKTINIIVTSSSGSIRTYKIKVTRNSFENEEHISKLSKLNIDGYDKSLNPEFHPLTTDYSLVIPHGEIDLNIDAEAFDDKATIKIENDKYLKGDTGIITITVSAPNVEDTIYKINYNKNNAISSKDNYLSELTTSNGALSPSFDPMVEEYSLILDKYSEYFILNGVLSDESATVIGLQEYHMDLAERRIINIIVTSESGDVKTYTINAYRKALDDNEHSSKLIRLDINGYSNALEPKFEPSINEYTLKINSKEIDLDINAEAFDDEANIEITGNKYIKDSFGVITVKVSEPNSEDTIYKINYEKIDVENMYTFDYTGDYQIFTVPVSGEYKIEAWGAKGAGDYGGNGAYTQGSIYLNETERLYVYVGNSPEVGATSFNGGGAPGYTNGYGGGGATDIRIKLDNLFSRIMVAAGGGGVGYLRNSTHSAGVGGNINGGNSNTSSDETAAISYGATQIAGGIGGTWKSTKGSDGTFGLGGNGIITTGTRTGSGGGGGYYGGAAGPLCVNECSFSSSGGSSYISGYKGSVAITAENDLTPRNDSNKEQCSFETDDIICSYHYSGKIFEEAIMKSGSEEMPTLDGTNVMTGNDGNGYVKITPIVVSEDNYLKELTTSNGTLSPAFNPSIQEYNLTLDKYDINFTLNGVLSDETSSVIGLDKYYIDVNETKVINIIVTSENGKVRIYKINAVRESLKDKEHSSKLSKLMVENYDNLTPEFSPLTNEYSINIISGEIDLNIITETYDKDAVVKVENNRYLKDDIGEVIITVSAPNVEDTIYKINYTKIESSKTEFDYTGGYQTFIVPVTGQYKVQLWGAEGGFGRTNWSTIVPSVYGGYTSGYINLTQGQKLYIFVGQKGFDSGSSGRYTGGAGGYNGGGAGGNDSNKDSSPEPGGGGGGATDIRLMVSEDGAWNNFESLKSRIMVAGGGAGGAYSTKGTSGGSYLNSENGYRFGIGENGHSYNGGSGGGAGGYYGGISTNKSNGRGYGGSSYISGHIGSDSIDEDSTEDNIIHTGESIHYSGLSFINTKMIDGDGYEWTTEKSEEIVNQPTYDGKSTQLGNEGNGYAVIEVSDLSKDNYLVNIVTNKGNLTPEFDPLVNEYSLSLTENDTKIIIEARPSSDAAIIDGLGEHMVPSGTTTYPVTVTSESGDVRVYNINITRNASSESKANNIEITGLTVNICAEYEGYCILDKEFDENENIYHMTVPSGIRELEFTVDKKHDYQTVIGDGIVKLEEENNIITIQITSEDKSNTTTYTYEITRDMSDDNYIKNINFINPKLDIGFDYLLTEYAFKVENDITKLDMEIELDDSEASYEIIGNEDFKVGNNIVEILVTARNKKVRSYILNVYRVSNSNPLLSNLEVLNESTNYTLSPEFEDIKTDYTLNVANEVTSVEIKASTQADTTIISGTGVKELKTGLNEFKIITTAEDGSMENYRIIITREKSSNNYISNLEVLEGSLDSIFTKENDSYNVEVNPYISKLTLNVELDDINAKYNVLGNNNFKMGKNLVTIRVTAENGDIKNYYITATKQGSDINYLSNITINNGMLDPDFDKEVLEYNVTVENNVTSITLKGEKEDILSSVKGLGTYRLLTGNNIINVIVTSETGITRTYKINVFRKYNNDASLKDIVLSTGTLNPSFNSDIKEYTVNVEPNVDEILVTGIKNVGTTTITGNGIYNIADKETMVVLKVVAEDGNTEEYRIKVIKDESSNTNLSYLLVKEGIINPSFDKMKVSYTVKVPNNITNVNIISETEDKTSSITITGESNLVIGENLVNVIVTSEDGSIKTYEITVIREEEEQNNLNLKTLDITSCNLNPSFNGNIQYYECAVDYDISSVTVNATAEDDSNTLTGTGEKILQVGRNLIGISVLNKEGIIKDYQVVVTRNKSIESRLKNISIQNHTLDKLFNSDDYDYNVLTKDKNLEFNFTKMHEEETIEVTGNSDFKLGENIVTVKVISQDKNHESIYNIHVTKEESDNNYLKLLEVEGLTISPGFSKGITEYNLTVEDENSNIIINAIPEYDTATVSGSGVHTLEKGSNKIDIIVTSESNKEKIYTLNVTRLGSKNNKLSNLEVEGFTINPIFNSSTKVYNLEVEYETKEIKINAQTESEYATVIGDGINLLTIGNNKLNVVVTSENGEINTYIINVNRKRPVTSKLENIKVNNYSLDKIFDPDVLDYTVIVDNEVTSLDLIIDKLDLDGSYEIIGNENFVVGLNNVEIISTSSDKNETTTYTLTVNRQSYSNTYLSNIIVSDGILSPSFDKTNLSYTVIVSYDVQNIKIDALAENSSSKVSGTGEYNLNVGENNINIKVTSLGGIIRIYNVNVIRSASNNVNVKDIKSNVGTIEKLNSNSYSLTVPNNITSINKDNFNVILEDPMASIEYGKDIDLSTNKTYVITVISADKSTTNEYIIYIKYELSSDAKIKMITANTGTLNREFDKDVYEYTLDVADTVTEVEFNVELNDERSTLLNENLVYTLDEYNTKIEFISQAEDGSILTYIVNVEKSITTEKYLKDIKVTGISDICESCTLPVFSETTYDYSLTVPYDVEEIGFDIIKKHQNQQIKIYKDNKEVSNYVLDTGINNYKIEVINSLGEVTNYNYSIERLKSTNNYLSSLKLTGPEYVFEDFNKEKLEYSVQVSYEYRDISIEAIPEDIKGAKVTIQGATYLLEGNNDVHIKVTSQTGDVREYIIHVLRTPESNNLIKTLTISSGDIYTLTPKFSPGITNYSLTVSSLISKITVEAIPDIDTTIIEGTGEFDLNIGRNQIILTSTSIDGVSREYTVNIIRESSKNVYLKTLKVNNGTIDKEFKKEVSDYVINIPNEVDSLDMLLEPEDTLSTIEVVGNKNLLYGENKVRIRVISSDKSAVKTYTLTVIKGESSNANLSSLSIDGIMLDNFNANVYEYNYTVENIKDSIVVDAVVVDKYATVTGNGLHSIDVGLNDILINVTAQNGDIKTYTIHVDRKTNAYLMDIITDRGEITPNFDRLINEYTINVDNNIKDITIVGLKENTLSNVIGNGKYNLNVGENIINLTVENSGNVNNYKINVIRNTSDNTYLEYLLVSEGVLSPIFNKEILEYKVYIPNDKTKITLDYQTEDELSTIDVIGNENLIEKENIVTIRVTSTNNNTRDYKITVIKEDEAQYSNKLSDITVSDGSLSPKFDPDINDYTVTVPESVEEIKVNAIRESLDSTVTGIGTYKLSEGRNVITLLVTSKDLKTRVYTIVVNKLGSNDARIKELEFNEGTLSPSFNKNIYNYTLNANSDAKIITIKNIVLVDEGATYEITGNNIITNGDNIININVISNDKSQIKTYQIKVSLEKSSNAKLSSLTTNVGTMSEEFNKDKYLYTVNVPNSVNSIIVDAKAESSKATVDGNGIYNLISGNNYINISVTAENGNTNIYSLVVVKEKSSNNNLIELLVRGYEFDKPFNNSVTQYNLQVENDIESIIIDATKEDINSIVTGTGKKDLEVGLNTFNIIVTSEDGSSKTYTIFVTRKKVESSKIKSLEIEEGIINPIFNSEVFDYYISIPNEYNSITPVIKLVEDSATYKIDGNENLNVGENIVSITVTSSNGDKSVYKVNVIRLISANNYLSNITINKGTLNPSFDRGTLNYEVVLPNEETSIIVNATPEVSSTTVTGIGEYNLNSLESIITLDSISESGIIRTYKIKVIREANTNNYLNKLLVSEGSLDPIFDKDTLVYNVKVPIGTQSIVVDAVKEESLSTLLGTGKYDIAPGSNEINLSVISESGDIRIYTINVIRDIDNNTNITNMTPSMGSLSPEFDNEINEYELILDNNINIVDIDVELESNLAVVTGNKGIIINDDLKDANIIITAEDGTQREIKLKISRKTNASGIHIDSENIILAEGEEYTINPILLPNNESNVEFIYSSSDENIASVTNDGLVKAISGGNATITITYKDNENIKTKMTVNVMYNKIKSNIYKVEEKETETIIVGADEGETVSEFLDKLLNDVNSIKVFDKENNEITNYDDVIKTGIKLKLTINGKEYHSAIIIVKGDINEDGIIDVTDKVMLQDHILSKLDIIDYRIYAADIQIDDSVDVADNVRLGDYILGKITTLN